MRSPKKLNKHDRLLKYYIRAEKELREIHEKMRALPYRKLEEPYQSGWKLILALRDDINRSKKGEVLRELIKKFAVNYTTRSSKLIAKIRKNPSVSHVSGLNIWSWQITPDVRSITKKEYDKLSEAERKYFYHSRFKVGYLRRENEYHFDVPSHYLIVKVDKLMVTHIQDIDPELVRREAELKMILEPFWRVSGGSYMSYYKHVLNRKERRRNKVELSKEKYELE